MALGTGLLKRAIAKDGRGQADFARLVFRTSRRTLVRMLAGTRPIEADRLTLCRLILREESK